MDLEKGTLIADRVHWISGEPPAGPIEAAARVRSRMADVAATINPLEADARAWNSHMRCAESLQARQ